MSEQIDCIIADLNMKPEGLEENQIAQTMAGLLTGWIWLRDYVFKDIPSMKEKTIIYTDYKDHLLAKVKSNELKGIKVISKKGGGSKIIVKAEVPGESKEEAAKKEEELALRIMKNLCDEAKADCKLTEK